ncbi:terminase family protein [Sphingomonas naphthae]|uniref:Terminase family protein n=1 Tax=Sphingomonas naphthae TaxID=1813468 RepID=A0ABY7TKB1_9SPHN|nr:terminase family protein [Sphingomonas naphthae]WCT73668.1 terminase family protein [Sphingomonas naphthae]
MDHLSVIERRVLDPGGDWRGWLSGLSPYERLMLPYRWDLWARPGQVAPAGDWRTWLMLAGRGFGKTRAGAEWVRGLAERQGGVRIALVGATAAEARAVMVEGDSGLLAIASPGNRPTYHSSLRRLTWPNGAEARLYSAAEPEGLRGPQHHHAWADEIGKWPAGREVWSNLELGLRLADAPRIVATTTPRAVPLVRGLVAAAGTIVTGGRSEDNRAHLGSGFLSGMRASYGGTRLGRQELDGVLLDDVEGALWPRDLIERCRVQAVPQVTRVVIGVDPPAGIGGDACGIVAVARGVDGHAYVIEDATVSGVSPEGWARAVAEAARRTGADRIVAEANNGGEMVRSVLLAADAVLPLTLVHASHGKVARAEPVQALYERGRVFHVGGFPDLEDQMAGLTAGGGYCGPGRSPDRADALVWALWALMLGPQGRPGVRAL